MAEPATGKLIVADPRLTDDPVFGGSVILLLHHSRQGTVGINLARPQKELFGILEKMGLAALAGGQPEERKVVMDGGPMESYKAIFYLHDRATGPASSEPLADTGFAWGIIPLEDGPIQVPADFFTAKPDTAVLAMGYAGWDAGQLDSELNFRMWHVSSIDIETLLAAEPEERWRMAYDQIEGPDFSAPGPQFGGFQP